MKISFEWDPDKAEANLRKHQVGFEEAKTVFADPLHLLADDAEHSVGEVRWWAMGASDAGRVLVVHCTDRGEVVRIIGARRATRSERRRYENG